MKDKTQEMFDNERVSDQSYNTEETYAGETHDAHSLISDIEELMNDSKYFVVDEDFKEEDIKEDVINHPKHYTREGAMESIDEMVFLFGIEAVKNFCLCNVWKYRYRASDKNGDEDIKKSDWYMRKLVELTKIQKDLENNKNNEIWGIKIWNLDLPEKK